jgi:hypothetical protein
LPHEVKQSPLAQSKMALMRRIQVGWELPRENRF